MPLDLPLFFKQALNAEEVIDDLAVLVIIDDATLAAPLRFTTSSKTRLSSEPLTYGLIASGQTYRSALLHVLLPNEREDNDQATDIVIDNVAEDIAPAMRGLSTDATVSISLVLVSQPDTSFCTITGLHVVDRSYELETVTISVSRHANKAGASDLLEPLAGEQQTRNKAPGLYR